MVVEVKCGQDIAPSTIADNEQAPYRHAIERLARTAALCRISRRQMLIGKGSALAS